MAKSYLKPLLALSGEATFDDARTKLMEALSIEELAKVAGEGLTECADRKVQERLVFAMLDTLKDHANAVEVAVPEGDRISVPPTPSGALQEPHEQAVITESPEISRKRKVTNADEKLDEPSQKAVKQEKSTEFIAPLNPLAASEAFRYEPTGPQNQLKAREAYPDTSISRVIIPLRSLRKTFTFEIGVMEPVVVDKKHRA